MAPENHLSTPDSGSGQRFATRWLSTGFEALAAEIAVDGSRAEFDLLIIGSGYGGAVAAAGLAGHKDETGRPLRIALLERGEEYLAGMFPSSLGELPGHVRLARPDRRDNGSARALFDLRPGTDVNVVVANALGGGSLINAGVMEEPEAGVFRRGWPEELSDKNALNDFYARARRLLGATVPGANGEFKDNTIEGHADHAKSPLKKFLALKRLAPDGNEHVFRPAPITVAMRSGLNQAGVKLEACKLCGDCATGCNHGAKDSLDVNLLVTAKNNGVQIYTGVTVKSLASADERANGFAWEIEADFTDLRLRALHPDGILLRARRVILAAGTLGSTEILLRSAGKGQLRASPRLGWRFSSNGDMLAFVYGGRDEVNAVADEDIAAGARRIGPTITGIVDLRRQQPGLVIEEMAVPGPLRRLFEELVTTAGVLHGLSTRDASRHVYGHPAEDPCAVDQDKLRRSSILALMGDDGAAGRIELADGEGPARIVWPGLKAHPLFDEQISKLAEQGDAHGGGLVIPNPVWRPLPASASFLLDNRTGPPLTVHPLGGCAMGNNSTDGVVNHIGQVFRPKVDPHQASTEVYESLAILDGSIIPTALGINPALTITAVALRAVDGLRRAWRLQSPTHLKKPKEANRPRFRQPPGDVDESGPETEAKFVERLTGPVRIRDDAGRASQYVAELTLEYETKPLGELARRSDSNAQTLSVNIGATGRRPASRLRLFPEDDFNKLNCSNSFGHQLDEQLDACAVLSAPVSGELTIMRRQASHAWARTSRGLWAWFRNRGMRDMWQERLEPEFLRRFRGVVDERRSSRLGILEYVHNALALASMAGEVRLFEYELRIHEPETCSPTLMDRFSSGKSRFSGIKRITYARRSNFWRQLQQLEVTRMPGLERRGPRSLELDTVYLADRRIPLFKLTGQRDQVQALADLTSFGAYFLRLLLRIHAWSLRKPDTARPRTPRRLPARIDGPHGPMEPEVSELVIDRFLNGEAVKIRLSHYPLPNSSKPPVLMIHGYSASGTTFAHHAVNPNMTSHLLGRGRDIWIVDLRTSAGMPTATHPWSFEEVAFADIPAAVDHVWQQTGQRKIDVVAHCMGSAMFSMALLTAHREIDPSEIRARPGWEWQDRYRWERGALPGRINRLVLTQVGPVVVFSPENMLRAYVVSYLKQLLPLDNYSFNPGPDRGLTDQLIDRLLATLPYPEEEFDLENPPFYKFWKRAEFVGTRHRMDALYGRDFSLRNMGQGVLDHIDDHFGPLSIDTVSYAIEFALNRTITNHRGRNIFVSPNNLGTNWQNIPTLSVHGAENGLAEVRTLNRMKDVLSRAGCDIQICRHEGFGHQDALIGRNAVEVFDCIDAFLDGRRCEQMQNSNHQDLADQTCIAEIPAAGPIIDLPSGSVRGADLQLDVRLGANPLLGRIDAVAFLPVRRNGDRFIPTTDIEQSLIIVSLTEDEDGDWVKVKLTLPSNPEARAAEGILTLPLYAQSLAIRGGMRHHLDRVMMMAPGRRDMSPHAYGERRISLTPPWLQNFRRDALPKIVDAIERVLESEADFLQPGLIELRQLQESDAKRTRIALGSCQYPPGMLDAEVAYRSYRQLGERIDRDAGETPDLCILCGDQVYVDATAGLFDPRSSFDRYEKPYRNLFASRSVRNVLRRVPSQMMLDDHELADNWEPGLDPVARERGLSAFLKYQLSQHDEHNSGSGMRLWRTVDLRGIPIFLLDTRTERKARNANDFASAHMLSEDQFRELERWLTDNAKAKRPLVVVSPSIILPRHRSVADGPAAAALRSDTWDGYPASLQRLFRVIVEQEIDRLVFLSGDLHLSGISQIRVTGEDGRQGGFVSVCSSGLYTPYPFANSVPAELVETECFALGPFRCQVAPELPFFKGDGFALVDLCERDGYWRIDYEFLRTGGDLRGTVEL